MGARLAIDETALIRGELFTILTNKDTGKLIALIAGTNAAEVIAKLMAHLSVASRMAVTELTLDMDASFDWVARQCFQNAAHVVDRFHVQKLVMECVQELRIIERQKILAARRIARETKAPLPAEPPHENGDTPRELLARSRYILFIPHGRWTDRQRERAAILFRMYPTIARAYALSQDLKHLYDAPLTRAEAAIRLKAWCIACDDTGISSMADAAATVRRHEGRILHFWVHRATNAFAESFNAKLKGFRFMLRGVRDLNFFLFRCERYFC